MISWIASMLALASALFEGGSMIAEKKTLMREHAMEFSAAMSICALLLVTPLWWLGDVKSLSLTAVGYIFIASLCSALTIYYIAKGLRHLAVSLATPFLAFGPLITAIFAFLFLGELITPIQWIGIIVILIGAYILQSHPHQHLLDPFKHLFISKYIKYIFVGMIFYALTGIMDKKIVSPVYQGGLGVAVISYLPLLFFFMAVIFMVMMLIFHDGFEGIGRGMKSNVSWLLVIALLTIAYKATIIAAIAIPGVLLSLVIPIKKLSAIFSTIIGGELFHEDHVLKNSFASIIMIVGAVLILL
jgi:drug/metabolite transporter (DMT)-like permease